MTSESLCVEESYAYAVRKSVFWPIHLFKLLNVTKKFFFEKIFIYRILKFLKFFSCSISFKFVNCFNLTTEEAENIICTHLGMR
jgi:hypothetical protein